MEFKNPNNDYVESAGGGVSWLWLLLFGPLYWAVKGVWRHFVAHLILVTITFGLVNLIYPFFVYAILKKHYLRMGWKPLGSERSVVSDTSQLESNIQQTENKGYIVIGAVVCVAVGLAIGFYKYADFGGPDPSDEIEQIIERKKKEEKKQLEKAPKTLEDGKVGPRYFEFPGTLVANLKSSRKFLQIGIGVRADNDEIISSIEAYQLELRRQVLNVMSEFTEDDIRGKQGRKSLARAIADGINQKLIASGGVGGINEAFFTSFVLQ